MTGDIYPWDGKQDGVHIKYSGISRERNIFIVLAKILS